MAQDDRGERQALAEAWYAVAQRFASADAYRRAYEVIASRPKDLDTGGRVLLAVSAQALGDYVAAEVAHRAVLQSAPALPEAKNNLAYALMLLGRSEDLAEAKRLADDAVNEKPENATFRDTLARVEARAGHLDSAVGQFRTALQTEPYHLEARLGLADVLAQLGQVDEAKSLLAALEKDLRLAPPPPPYLAEQLAGVRKRLRAQ